MSYEIILMALAVVFSSGIVSTAYTKGFLQGAYKRALAGGSTYLFTSNYLIHYSQFETFLSACYNGALGLVGFAFLASLLLLIVTYVSNFVEYRSAIM